jgi:hypothetical protein
MQMMKTRSLHESSSRSSARGLGSAHQNADKNVIAKGWQNFSANDYAFLLSINPYFSVYANGGRTIFPGISSLKNLAK